MDPLIILLIHALSWRLESLNVTVECLGRTSNGGGGETKVIDEDLNEPGFVEVRRGWELALGEENHSRDSLLMRSVSDEDTIARDELASNRVDYV